MGDKKRFLARFAGISVLLFLVWVLVAGAYGRIPACLASVVLSATGAQDVRLSVDRRTFFLSGDRGGGGLSAPDVTLGSVFFASLGLAMAARRKPQRLWRAVAIGLGVLLALQAATLVLFGYGFGHQAVAAVAAAKALSAMGKFLAPILLWILLFYLPSRTDPGTPRSSKGSVP